MENGEEYGKLLYQIVSMGRRFVGESVIAGSSSGVFVVLPA